MLRCEKCQRGINPKSKHYHFKVEACDGDYVARNEARFHKKCLSMPAIFNFKISTSALDLLEDL